MTNSELVEAKFKEFILELQNVKSTLTSGGKSFIDDVIKLSTITDEKKLRHAGAMLVLQLAPLAKDNKLEVLHCVGLAQLVAVSVNLFCLRNQICLQEINEAQSNYTVH